MVTESVLLYQVSNTSISADDIEQQLRQRLGSNNSFDGLQLDSIRGEQAPAGPHSVPTATCLGVPVLGGSAHG